MLRSRRSQGKLGFIGGTPGTKTAGAVFFSQQVVPVLRRSTRSDEPDSTAAAAVRGIACGDFSADCAAIVLHGRSAQAAIPLVVGSRKPPGSPVRTRPGAGRSTGCVPALVHQPALRQW